MAEAGVKLRTALFFAGWILGTGLGGLLALPCLVSRRATWKVAQVWCAATLYWLRITCGITSRVEGLEHLAGAALIAAKHQSAWDTLMLWRVLKNPVFVLKRELYYIPVFGWYLWRSGQIAIDRTDRREAMAKVIEGTAVYAAQGRKLLMFPEGTRIPPGSHGQFRPGIARVSRALNLKVVPAALNAGYFWPKRPVWKTPGNAVLQFLPAMEPCGEDMDGWMKEIEQRITSSSDAIAPREYK